MAASTASTCRRNDPDSVHSQKRDHDSSREKVRAMSVTLAEASEVTRTPQTTMEKFVIEGGVPLAGTVTPAGNKNGALPILAACLLTEDEVVLRNVPAI